MYSEEAKNSSCWSRVKAVLNNAENNKGMNVTPDDSLTLVMFTAIIMSHKFKSPAHKFKSRAHKTREWLVYLGKIERDLRHKTIMMTNLPQLRLQPVFASSSLVVPFLGCKLYASQSDLSGWLLRWILFLRHIRWNQRRPSDRDQSNHGKKHKFHSL